LAETFGRARKNIQKSSPVVFTQSLSFTSYSEKRGLLSSVFLGPNLTLGMHHLREENGLGSKEGFEHFFERKKIQKPDKKGEKKNATSGGNRTHANKVD
jgi:hypothetical protein